MNFVNTFIFIVLIFVTEITILGIIMAIFNEYNIIFLSLYQQIIFIYLKFILLYGETFNFITIWKVISYFLIFSIIINLIINSVNTNKTHYIKSMIVGFLILILCMFFKILIVNNYIIDIIIIIVVFMTFFSKNWKILPIIIFIGIMLNLIFLQNMNDENKFYQVGDDLIPNFQHLLYCAEGKSVNEKYIIVNDKKFKNSCFKGIDITNETKIDECSGSNCQVLNYYCNPKKPILVKFCNLGCKNGICK
jgi:hypothetical protein